MPDEPYTRLTESDLAFVRVLEDVIELLDKKKIIDIAELPAAAREKLAARHKLRFELHGIDELIAESDDEQ